MQELEKKPNKKNKISTILQNLYEFLEQDHMDSIILNCFGIFLYFFHMISYIYYFSINEITDSYTQYICNFHYYLNLTNILHYIKSYQFTLLIFSLSFLINLIVMMNMINHIFFNRALGKRGISKKIDLSKMIINKLCNLFFWHLMFLSIEMLMIGFKNTEETEYLRRKINPDNFFYLKIIGILGIFMSFINGSILLYFNQDYKFLDKSKIRLNLSMKVIFCLLIRLFLLILYNSVQNSEFIYFVMIYCFLFLNFLIYLTNIPFKNKTISICFISLLCYSFSNILILTMFRINYLISEHDILPINTLFLILCIKLGRKIYYNYYYFYLLYEGQNKKIPVFALEEIIALFQSYKTNEKNAFLRLGYFHHHRKICFNPICPTNIKNNMEECEESFEINKKSLFEFIYQNFKDLIESEKKFKKEKGDETELLVAKFISFLMKFAQNPVLSFYEIQKILSTKKKFSIYFSILSLSISHSLKSNMKIFPGQKDSENLDLKKKNTYQEFFKNMETKRRVENNFKRILISKISLLEKTLMGFHGLKELFVINLRLTFLIKNFKKDLKEMNEIAPYQKVFKYKFSALLNSLIFNKFVKANSNEKLLAEVFKSKNDELYNRTLLYELLGDDTVICEVSFIDPKGKVLEKSKNVKFLRFFGYSNKDGQKVSYAHNLMPEFLRDLHEKFVRDYIEQKNKYRQSDFLSFGIDKDDFVFPVNINIALKYHEEDDFVLYSAFTKTSGFPSNFCLCTMDGEILDVSRDFFQEIAEEYDFLKVGDLKYVNIFQLMPEFSTYIKSLVSITESKANCYKLYLPKELKALIESKKKNKIEREISTAPNTKTINPKITFLKDYMSSFVLNFNFEHESKIAELTFDLSPTHYGQGDCLIQFLILKITKFTKPEKVEKVDSAENINDATILHAINTRNNEFPRLINLYGRDQEKKDRFGAFGTKLCTMKESLKENTKESRIQKKEHHHSENHSAIGEARVVKQGSLHNSSTALDYKTSRTVFSALKILKKMLPNSLKLSILSLMLQIFFSLIFAMLYYVLSEDYINSYFKPIQIGLREFSLQYHFNGDMMLSLVKHEYFYLKLINATERPEYGYFMHLVYNQSMTNVKRINDGFKNNQLNLNFEKTYKERLVNYYEGYDFRLKQTEYIDFIDKILNHVNTYFPILLSLNEKLILNYNDFLFLARNFPSYLTETSYVWTQFLNEFATSDQERNTILFNILLTFLCICMFLKILETFQWFFFMNLLKNLLKTYLRIGEEEITVEINTLKNFFELIKDSNEKYFNYNAAEIIQKEVIIHKEVSHKIKEHSKNRKRTLYSDLKGLPKFFLIIYYIICTTIIAFYFIFSYFSWMNVDKYVLRLTNTNALFANTYIYSSSIAFVEELLYRDKIIRNPEFEKINVTLQTKAGRIQWAKAALDKRMGMIANTSTINILLDGIDDSAKLAQMNQLLSGNLCELLAREYDFIVKQTIICENLLNGAFTKGLGTTMSEMFKNIKNREPTLQYAPKDDIDDLNQQERIREYIKSKDYFDMYLTEVFLHEILNKFYKINSDFYNEYLDKELSGLFSFLFVFLSFIIILNIFLIYFIKSKIRLMYKCTCRILFFIPYGRIIKDEQMLSFFKRLQIK